MQVVIPKRVIKQQGVLYSVGLHMDVDHSYHSDQQWQNYDRHIKLLTPLWLLPSQSKICINLPGPPGSSPSRSPLKNRIKRNHLKCNLTLASCPSCHDNNSIFILLQWFLPPVLAEEVIFLVSVCLFTLCKLNCWTYGPKIWHMYQGPSYQTSFKFKVTKVKKLKISFSYDPFTFNGTTMCLGESQPVLTKKGLDNQRTR